MPPETTRADIAGEWVIRLDETNLRKVMDSHGIPSFKRLAQVAGIGERTILRALSEKHVRDTAAGKLARALEVSPHVICKWNLR